MESMLKIRQISYAEKHRIYELFRNVVKALVMCQPPDLLRFIKWYLKNRGRHSDVPKIILVYPPRPNSDNVYIAINIGKSTGVVTIDRRNVMLRHQRKRENGGKCITDFVTLLIDYMKAKGALHKGWILLDIPNSKEEADRLISLGILPTHTLVLNYNILDSDPNQMTSVNDKFNQSYKNFELNIKTKFRYSLKEIRVHNKSIDEITELCLEQILIQKPSPVPYIPKIALLGPKESKHFIIANEISKNFNIVHVDFDQILEQKNILDDDENSQEKIHTWLNEKIMHPDCVEKGYVLTGFPRTRSDFEWLDSSENAPNRVIFLTIDFLDVYMQLENRCINKKTGAFMSLDQTVDQLKSGDLKLEHVSRYQLDSGKLFCEYQTYSNRLKDMLYYCGNNCCIITGDETVYDKVAACIRSGNPVAGPRPQNCEPSRLTKSLKEKIFVSQNDVHCKDIILSNDAKRLLSVLEQNN